MDIQTLQERQRWTLEQKIDHAVATVENYIAKTGKTPYVSFSGGKDSTVLLDLVRRFVDSSIKGVFCNTGNEFPEIVRFVRSTHNVIIIRPNLSVRKVLSTYGFPLISKEQAHGIRQARTTKSKKLLNIRLYGTDKNKGYISGKIADKWQPLIYAPFTISEMCCDCLKKKPFKLYQKETGDSSVVSYLKKGTQVFVRGDFSAKTFTNANGVQVSINCRVRELQLLSAKQDGAQASQQPTMAQPSTPQAASTAAFAPNPFSSETGKDDLPF